MNENTLIDAIGNIDEAMIEKHIKARAVSDAGMRGRQKSRVWIKWVSLAACLALIVSAIPLWALMRSRTEQPGTTADEGPATLPNGDGPRFSAEDIAGLFGVNDSPTQYYEKVYAPGLEAFDILEIPDAEYLPVYARENSDVPFDRDSLLSFANEHLPGICEALEIEGGSYTLDEWSDDEYYARLNENLTVFFSQYNSNSLRVSHFTSEDDWTFTLYGDEVTVDQTQSDGEIIQSLSGVRDSLEKMLGRSFPNVRVRRHYSSYHSGVALLFVDFYDKFESHYGLSDEILSDYVTVFFQPKKDDEADSNFLDFNFLSYYELRTEQAEEGYKILSNEKMISLEKAEEMLKSGYVFGGHICRLCARNNAQVDFSDYDAVGIAYISGIPFYVFYKQIGAVPGGNLIYARTYVPAIEVSGLEEYFEAQESVHKNESWWEEDYPTAPKDEDE